MTSSGRLLDLCKQSPINDRTRGSLHSTWVYLLTLYFVKNQRMSYAEIIEIVMPPILLKNTPDFPRFIIYGDKNACFENSIPRHMVSCLCDLFIVRRMIPLIVKLLDITIYMPVIRVFCQNEMFGF